MDSDRPSMLEPGYLIGRYELLYALAQGGMGAVWVARLQGKHGFEKLYAVKTILPKYAADAAFRAMFLDEARIAAAIDHPNVVQILNLDEQDGLLYQIMEYVEGDSVQRLLRTMQKANQTIPLGVALRIAVDTCSGLHAAHELTDEAGRLREVVHRDVTPHNVLVSTGGIAKLTDFGIAKARDRIAGETSEGVLKGKIRYAPPEQIASKQGVDRRADVWGAAAVLRMMITGEPPYAGETDMDVLRSLISGDPPSPLPRGVPEPVANVLTRALEPDRNARFATALDFAEALERAMTETQSTCSTPAVGAWVKEHTAKRIESRRESLDLALRAIAARAHMREVLRRPMSQGGGSDGSMDGIEASVDSPRELPISEELARGRYADRPGPDDLTVRGAETQASASNAPMAPAGMPRPLGRIRVIAIAGAAALAIAGATIGFTRMRAGDSPSPPATTAAATGRPEMLADPVPVDLGKDMPTSAPAPMESARKITKPALPSPPSPSSASVPVPRAVVGTPRASGAQAVVLAPSPPVTATAGDTLRGTIDSRK